MLAAFGSGWFTSLQECADAFISVTEAYEPNEENVKNINNYLNCTKKCINQRSD
ncbi:hypothetical protein ACI2OX_14325 [Bacillus sp. N9]